MQPFSVSAFTAETVDSAVGGLRGSFISGGEKPSGVGSQGQALPSGRPRSNPGSATNCVIWRKLLL